MRIKRKPNLAESADRHVLYQESVQDVETEIDFVQETYEELRGKPARLLREDFCGTANTACEWIRRSKHNKAVGVDLDAEVLGWGQKNNVEALSASQRARIALMNADVLTAKSAPQDIILGMNFSYYLFKTRDELRAYFQAARDNLADDGILFLDAFGGYEAHQELEEPRECDGFDYIWDQAEFNPINHHMTCHIHFEFKDGSRMDKAFSYTWRLWQLPEITELLTEAGFSQVDVYWEGTDEDTEEGNGIYEPSDIGDADAGWICYIVAQR